MNPYVWTDVAIVHAVAAMPLAMMLAAAAQRRLPRSGLIALAALLAMSFTHRYLSPTSLQGIAGRVVLALQLTLALALVCFAIRRPATTHRRVAAWLLATLCLVVVPSVYVWARCRHDVARLGELLEQSRFGEARTLCHALLVLDDQQHWRGQPLARTAAEIDDAVRALEAQIVSPLALTATDAERLDRACTLAMLGRNEQALVVLDSVSTAAAGHTANLRGTIHEARGDWPQARNAYRSARAIFAGQRTPELVQAVSGIAYCQRKLGDYAAAEQSYLQMLDLAPNAASHFLLAQFYEDAQQADKARQHARQAMALSPDRYEEAGLKLIRKLSVYHFGCLGVHAAEHR